jgi:hypothetical protein
LVLLKLILVAAVFLGDAAERLCALWTGGILAGVIVGPGAIGVPTPSAFPGRPP